MAPLTFYVPKNLKPTTLPENHRDAGHFFLNLLHWKWVNWQADEKGWIALKTEYVRQVISQHDWPAIRDRLISRGVVHATKTWTPGQRSMQFQLAPKYRETQRVQCTDAKLIQRIEKLNASERNLNPVHRWLTSKFDAMDVDDRAARKIIARLRPDATSPMAVGEYRELIAEQHKRRVDRDYRTVVDHFGRFHSPLTSMPKALRCCLSVEGELLVNLDLANSQPLMAGICAREFFRNRLKRSRLLKRTFAEDASDVYRSFRQSIVSEPSDNEEVEEYIDLCARGKFYESLMEDDEDRGEFKEKFFTEVLFGKASLRTPLKRRFGKRHAAIAEMLDALKRPDHRRSAWIMQNAEATIFIDGICGRMMRERPDLIVFTIHDSFLVRARDAEYVRTVVMDEFKRLEINPQIRIE